jgi:hypothetical protein
MQPGQAQKLSQQLQASQDDASIVEKRLDTSELKTNLRYYLAGVKTKTRRNEAGELERYQEQDEDLRKLNEEGIHTVMTLVESTLSSAVVQGNTSEEQYNSIVGDFHEAVYEHLWVQGPRYGLHEEDYEMVVETITHMTRLFLSRTIGDGERDALSNSMTVNESHNVSSDNNSNGFFNGFFGG